MKIKRMKKVSKMGFYIGNFRVSKLAEFKSRYLGNEEKVIKKCIAYLIHF